MTVETVEADGSILYVPQQAGIKQDAPGQSSKVLSPATIFTG